MSHFDDDEIERVRERIRSRTASLTENFHNVQSEVSHKVESVKQSLDVRRPIRRNPTSSVLGSLAAGLLLGLVTGGRKRRQRRELESLHLQGTTPPKAAAAGGNAGLLSGLVVPIAISLAKKAATGYVESRLAGGGSGGGGGGGGGINLDLSRLNLPFFRKKSTNGYSAASRQNERRGTTLSEQDFPVGKGHAPDLTSEPYFDGYPPDEPNPTTGATKPSFGARNYDGSR